MAYVKRKYLEGQKMENQMSAITIKDQNLSIMQLGEVLIESGYFQDAKQAAQAVVKVLAGIEIGLGPIAAMTGIYIIKGRITLSANTMAAVIKNSGKYDYRIIEHSNEICKIEFYQAGERVGLAKFSMDDANQASLVGGQNWQKFPRNMLFARALSNGARWFCADVFAGNPAYTPDEVGANVDGKTGQVIDGQTTKSNQQLPNDKLKSAIQALNGQTPMAIFDQVKAQIEEGKLEYAGVLTLQDITDVL